METIIEIVERRKDGSFMVGPLEDLSSKDFDQLSATPGCVTEIYPENHQFLKVAQLSPTLADPATKRILLITGNLLLITVIKSKLRRFPHWEQLYCWLTQDSDIQSRQFWLREVELFDDEERDCRQHSEEVDRVLEEFFGQHLEDGPTIWLTEEIQ